jgi:hypothetical protein
MKDNAKDEILLYDREFFPKWSERDKPCCFIAHGNILRLGRTSKKSRIISYIKMRREIFNKGLEMRKSVVSFICLLAFSYMLGWSQENSTEKKQSFFWSRLGVSLKFYGGGSYITGGDVNLHIKGTHEINKDSPTWDVNGAEPRPLHLGFNIGGEVFFNITSRLEISIGGGLFTAEEKANFEFIPKEALEGPLRNEFIIETASTYYTTGIHFKMPVKDTVKIAANVGIGYYKGNIDTQSYYYLPDTTVYDSRMWGGKFSSIGFNGGLGLEIDVFSKVCLVFEAVGRYAKMKNKSGYDRWFAGLEERRYTKEGILWYQDLYLPTAGKTYPQIVGLESKPDHPHYQNPRKANFDLSGVSLRVGFKFKLN